LPNAIDATLINSVLAQAVITKTQNKLAFLGAMTTDFSQEVRDQRSRVLHVPIATATSAVQTNPTDFESGDTTLTDAVVTMAHLSKSFYLTSADIGSGSKLENLARINMATLANAIEAAVFVKLTEAAYATATVTGLAAGTITAANLKSLWGALPGDEKNLLIRDTEIASLLPSDLNGYDITRSQSGFGFDGIYRTGNGFASAGTKLVAAAINRNAIAVASALPEYSPAVADLLDSTVIELPELGLSVQSSIWASSKTRNTWASFDVLFGAAVGDITAAKFAKLV
jgi:hypothetical protein